MVSDTDSFLTARRLAVEEGILAGGSTGTAVWAALQLAPELHRDDVVVVLVPDSGRGYLSKLYNDEWMADHGFLRTSGHTRGRPPRAQGRPPDRDDPRAPDRDRPPGDRRHGRSSTSRRSRSSRPSPRSRPPRWSAPCTSATSCNERCATRASSTGRSPRSWGRRLPSVGSGETVDIAVRRLEESPAVIVLDNGHPVGVITRSDALAFLAQAGAAEGGTMSDARPRGTVRASRRGPSTPARSPDPLDRGRRDPDPPRFDLRPAGRRRAQGLRLLAHAQPDAGLARDDDRRPRRRRATASPSRAGWRPWTPCCACSRPGDHLLIPNDAYGGTYRLVASIYAPAGVGFSPVELQSPAADRGRVARRDPPRLDGDAEQPEAARHRHRGRRRDRPRPRRALHRRQHLRHAVPAAAPRPRCRRRRALVDQVPGRPLRRGGRPRRDERRRARRAISASSRTRPEPCRARSTATSCSGASRPSPCASTASARTPGVIAEHLARAPGRRRRSTTRASPSTPGTSLPARQMLDFGAMVSFTLRRRRGRRHEGGRRHAAVHARRVPRRRRVADRAACAG